MEMIAMSKGEIYVIMQPLHRFQIEFDPVLVWQELIEMVIEPLIDKRGPPHVIPSELDVRHNSEYAAEFDE
jgi:hypothetical protein